MWCLHFLQISMDNIKMFMLIYMFVCFLELSKSTPFISSTCLSLQKGWWLREEMIVPFPFLVNTCFMYHIYNSVFVVYPGQFNWPLGESCLDIPAYIPILRVNVSFQWTYSTYLLVYVLHSSCLRTICFAPFRWSIAVSLLLCFMQVPKMSFTQLKWKL